MTTTQRPPMRIPRVATALRLPLWQRGQERMRQRWGFDMNSPDALDRARRLLGEQPSDPERMLLHASVLAMRGNNEDAERDARRAAELQPDLARAHTTLATLLVQRGEGEEGLSEARRAAELDAQDATVQYNLGLAEWATGNRRDANAAFQKAWELLYGDVHGTGRRPPWWRRVFRRGTVGTAAPPPADGTTQDPRP